MVAQQSVKSFLFFPIFSVLFILSMFNRVSNAVIAPNLTRDLGLNADSLGIIGGAYFYSFALLQIPIGPILDRIGPRSVMTSCLMIGAFGTFLFAFGESFTTALIGRILIGVGMAPVLVGILKIFTLKFTPEKFATLLGLILSVGTLGNILATSPLAFLTARIGWRMVFTFSGGIIILLGFLVFWVLGGERRKDMSPVSIVLSGPETGILESIRLVVRSLSFWQIGLAAFFRYGTFVGLQGLWLGPYLIDIQGYSPLQTGNLLILLAIGTIVGSPIAGRLSDRFFYSKKSVVLWGLSLYSLSLFPLIGVLEIQSPFWYGLIFFLMGFFSGSTMMVYAHAKDLFPITISGTVMTLINFFSIAGGAVFMPTLGKFIVAFPRVDHSYPAEAYHFSFLICFLVMIVSLLFYAFSKK